MNVYTSVSELIGKTPLIELTKIEKEQDLKARLYAKVEFFNPSGSAKDRAALYMIKEALKDGRLKEGGTIIEPTSGNTGIGLACIGVPMGFRIIIVMPDSMSVERQLMMKAYGAELILTDGALGMKGAIAKAEELKKSVPGSIIAGQFENPANPKAHFETTGPEIYSDLDGNVDAFVAGVGTGGTLSGTGNYLKKMNPACKVIAVEPFNSAVLSGEPAGKHDLQGIGGGFIPDALDTSVYDEIIKIKDEEAYECGRTLASKEGLLTGITSGAALAAAIKYAKRPENEKKNIVVFLPDTGMRYLSTKMFS